MFIKIIIFFVLAIIFLVHYLRIKDLKSIHYWKNKNNIILEQCRKRLKEVYGFINTSYKFLHAGTLLGCVRDNDIIPYDDDIDIGVYVENINKIYNIQKSICKVATKYGYQCKKIFFGLKLIKNDKYKIGIDIFFYNLDKNNRIISISKKARKMWPNEYYFVNELKNLKKGRILNDTYNICSNTNKVLNRFYGNKWKEKHITHTHIFDLYNFQIKNITFQNIIDFYLIYILKILKINKVS
jgi:phosphorylcholine metabolism protein LicD